MDSRGQQGMPSRSKWLLLATPTGLRFDTAGLFLAGGKDYAGHFFVRSDMPVSLLVTLEDYFATTESEFASAAAAAQAAGPQRPGRVLASQVTRRTLLV